MMNPPFPPPRQVERSSADDTGVPPPQRFQTRVKSEQLEQCHSGDDGCVVKTEKHSPDNFIVKGEAADQEGKEAEHRQKVGTRKGVKRSVPCPPRLPVTLRGRHHRQLDILFHTYMHEHRWKQAAGVLYVLLLGITSACCISDDDIRRYYTAALELERRVGGDRNYKSFEGCKQQIFEAWMRSLSRYKNDAKAIRQKNMVLNEQALLYLIQGNIDDAYSKIQFVIQDGDLANESSVNLLHGMILYQLWYSSLPQKFKINGFDNCMPKRAFGFAFDDGYQDMETDESSNIHYAAVTEHIKFSPQCASESSFGNDKPKTKLCVAPPRQEFYGSHSADDIGQKTESCYPSDNLRNSSIFFARGLDTDLLPIRLDHLTGDIEHIIYEYRKLSDALYTDAVKHLKLALHSINPVALLPLIQLLLLGDRVEEAFEELDYSCRNIDTALPFRLMARLLECFQRNKVNQICSNYANALKRDPICCHSLDRLVAMHKSGNCSTMLMFEMIALHLDAADGQSSIWEEFASCFLQLQIVAQSEYEDCTSENLQRGWTKVVSSSKIPAALKEENARGSWKLRFLWWKRRHFSNSCLREKTAGEQKLLCYKAACASHLYGPTDNYVARIFKSLEEMGDHCHLSILKSHMQKAMNLLEQL